MLCYICRGTVSKLGPNYTRIDRTLKKKKIKGSVWGVGLIWLRHLGFGSRRDLGNNGRGSLIVQLVCCC
jgi:hypothetical protein